MPASFRHHFIFPLQLVLITSLGLVGRSFSQIPPPPPTTLSELSRELRQWGVDEGLPQGRIDRIARTPDGYLWLGGNGGFSRFNGRHFENFDGREILGNRHSYISRFAVEKNGTLWIGSTLGGLAYLDGEEFIPLPDSPPRGNISTMAAHPDGGLVSCYRKDGTNAVWHITRSSASEIGSPIRNDDVMSIDVTTDGRIWVVTKERKLFEVTANGWTAATPDQSGLSTLFRLNDGTLAQVVSSGFLSYQSGSWTLSHTFRTSLPKNLRFGHVAQDLDGYLWCFAARDGYWIISPDMEISSFQSGPESPPEPVTDMLATPDGNLWISSFSGLYQVRYSPFTTLIPPRAVATPQVVTLAEDGEGNLWSSMFGAICFANPGRPDFQIRAKTPPFETFLVAGDSQSGVYFSDRMGQLTHWRNGTTRRIPTKSKIFAIVPQPDGPVWIASNKNLFRLDPDQGETIETVNEEGLPSPSPAIGGILHPTTRQPCIQIRNQGFFQRNENKSWDRITPPNDELANQAASADFDSEGGLWMISDTKIGCWAKGETWQLDRSILGMVASTRIVTDRSDGLWISTERNGVAHFSRSQFRKRARDPKSPLEITWFDQRHGLASRNGPFSRSGVTRTRDGRIWVATARGASVVDPELWMEHRKRSSPPSVLIESCSADGKELSIPFSRNKPFELPTGVEWLRIEYDSMDYGRRSEANFRYRIKGISDSWVEAGNERIAQLNQLPPGEYRFELMAANRFGQWSTTPAILDLVVPPHWWQTSTFKIGTVIAIALLVWTIYWLRVQQFKQQQANHYEVSRKLIQTQESERKRIAAELHDGLGQNLTIAKNRLTMESRKNRAAAPSLAPVSGLISQALDEVRSMSHNLRPNVLDNIGLTKAIEELVRETREATGIEVQSHIENIDRLLSPENEINFYRIVQESLNNMVKHSDASGAEVQVTKGNSRIILTVADDGRGFNSDTPSTGMGLSGIHERARILGGTLTITSARREGTTIHLESPTSKKP